MPKVDQRAMVHRRAVLAAALAGSVGGLTGCGIRVANGAPHVPGLKQQGPPADQAVLRSVRRQLDGAIEAAAADSSAWAEKLAAIHREQRTRLTQVMATQGMTPAPTPRPTGPKIDRPALFLVEQRGARQAGSCVNLSARNLPMATAITVTENAGATMLGHSIRLSGGTVPSVAVVLAILPALRAAIYALEVIVAKTPLTARKRGDATLTTLHAARATWEASLGKDLPTPPDGYALPVDPTTSSTRRTLAQRVLTDLITACAGQASATRGDRGALTGLAALWADGTAELWQWGATPTPFPGLTP